MHLHISPEWFAAATLVAFVYGLTRVLDYLGHHVAWAWWS